MRLSWIDILSYLAYLGFFGFVLMFRTHSTLAYTALGLSLACAVLWVVARRQLGNAFSVTAQAHQLVTQGLYSKIRHPIYVFGTLAFLFVVLALMGWAALVVLAVVLLIQVFRLRREEQLLAKTFGDEYIAYRSRTWF